jgi:hypothetical protein
VLVRVSLICPASAQVGSYLFPASQPRGFPAIPKTNKRAEVERFKGTGSRDGFRKLQKYIQLLGLKRNLQYSLFNFEDASLMSHDLWTILRNYCEITTQSFFKKAQDITENG